MRLPASARRRSRPDVRSSRPSRCSLIGCWAKFASWLADGWRKIREAQRAWDLRLTDTGFIGARPWRLNTVWPGIRSDGCRRWQHLKDRSRGGTRGPMSKELLTSADATRPGYGLRGHLLLAFIALSSFAAISPIVGTYAPHTPGNALHQATGRWVP